MWHSVQQQYRTIACGLGLARLRRGKELQKLSVDRDRSEGEKRPWRFHHVPRKAGSWPWCSHGYRIRLFWIDPERLDGVDDDGPLDLTSFRELAQRSQSDELGVDLEKSP